MCLPAGLQAQHVAGDIVRAKILGKLQHQLLVEVGTAAIPNPQAPACRPATAAREEVVALHRLQHVRPGEEVDVHA